MHAHECVCTHLMKNRYSALTSSAVNIKNIETLLQKQGFIIYQIMKYRYRCVAMVYFTF